MNQNDDPSPSELGRAMIGDLRRSLTKSTRPPPDGSIDRPLLISPQDTDADLIILCGVAIQVGLKLKAQHSEAASGQ